APATAAVGDPANVTVSALDQNGNLDFAYAGKIHFASSDAQAQLPADYTFVPALDGGQHVFSVTLNNSGSRTVSATDTSNGSLTSTATVSVSGSAIIDYSNGFASHGNLTNTGSTAFVADPVGTFQNHQDVGTNGNPSALGKASFANGVYTLVA